MSQLQQQFRDWFASRPPQERMILLAGTIVLVLAVFYVSALSPFYRAIDARAERVAQKEQDLAFMRGTSAEIRAQSASQAGPAPTGESLVVLVDRTAREAGLGSAVTGQTPMGNGGMRVELNGASFDSLVVWLGTLQQRYAVSTESANIARTDKAGLVNASLVLSRPGG